MTQKYIILIKNVYLEKALVTYNIVNSLIKVLFQFTGFFDILLCPLNSTKLLMILHKHFKVSFI